MSVNKVILVGRAGKDPELKQLQNGSYVCKFSVATSERYTDKAGQKQENTEWHNIVCFGKLAEVAGRFITKGKQVYLEGKITYRSWEQDGQKKHTTEIICKELTFLSGGEKKQGVGSYQQQQSRQHVAPVAPPVDDSDDIPF